MRRGQTHRYTRGGAGQSWTGGTNLSIGVHTAHQDRLPMLALVGQVASGERGRGALQEVDLAAFFAPISTWAVEARRSDDVPGLVAEALGRAVAGHGGPAIVVVPADYWDQPFARPVSRRVPAGPGPVPDEVAGILARARYPVAIAGGPSWPVAGELVSVAERLGLGVYSAFRQQGVFPEDHPCYLGHLGIAGGGVLLALGSGHDWLITLIAGLLLGFGAGAGVSPGLFLAGRSVPSNRLGPTFALVELLRSEAAYLLGPVLLHLAMTSRDLTHGIRLAVLVTVVVTLAAGAVLVCVLLLGGARPHAPDLDAWLDGRSPAFDSPRLAALLRSS